MWSLSKLVVENAVFEIEGRGIRAQERVDGKESSVAFGRLAVWD